MKVDFNNLRKQLSKDWNNLIDAIKDGDQQEIKRATSQVQQHIIFLNCLEDQTQEIVPIDIHIKNLGK